MTRSPRPPSDRSSTIGTIEATSDHDPLVSIVMSVYNGAEDLEGSVRSLLRQTWSDFELIVIDDGSTDETPRILESLAAEDDRIRVVQQENQGLTAALRHGCKLARGRYIARQDADDWSHPDRLALQLELLQSNARLGLVSCTTQYVGPEGEPLCVIRRPTDPREATRRLLDERQGPPAHGSVVFRRDLYEQVAGYRTEFYFGQDADLWLRMAEQAEIGYCNEVLYFCRITLSSISSTRRSIQAEFGRLGQRCRAARREGGPERPHLDAARHLADRAKSHAVRGSGSESAAACYYIGSMLLDRGDARCRRYLRRSLTFSPRHWRRWIKWLRASTQRLDTEETVLRPCSPLPPAAKHAMARELLK